MFLIVLNFLFLLFFKIYDEGYISFDHTVSNPYSGSKYIAAYFRSTLKVEETSSVVYHREDTTAETLSLANKDIRSKYPNSGLIASSALIVTWVNVTNSYKFFGKNTFQIVVARNNKQAYVILNYDRLDDTGGFAAFNLDSKCANKVFAPLITSYKLVDHSNMGVKGRYVSLMNISDCDLEDAGKYLLLTLDLIILKRLLLT